MWERYCRGVNAIVFMVDAADEDKLEVRLSTVLRLNPVQASRNELIQLLDKPQLDAIPVLVLGNKKDLPGALDERQLIERMLVILSVPFQMSFQELVLGTEQRNLLLFDLVQGEGEH